MKKYNLLATPIEPKIAFIIAGYECAHLIRKCVAPLKSIENSKTYFIHGLFREYEKMGKPIVSQDGTALEVAKLESENLIDKVVFLKHAYLEHEIRNVMLEEAKEDGCDIAYIVDADEHYNVEQLKDIIKFVKNTPNFLWYKVAFQNFVISPETYVDNFIAPRIFRMARDFAWTYDNDAKFGDANMYSVPWCVIPRNTSKSIRHLSWVYDGTPESKKRLIDKIEFQKDHHNGLCSYAWDEEKNKLTFDESYYILTNQTIPPLRRLAVKKDEDINEQRK